MNKKYFLIVLLCAVIPASKAEAPSKPSETVEQEEKEKIPPFYTEEIIFDDEDADDLDLDAFAEELKEAAERPKLNLSKRLRILLAVMLNASHVWYHSTIAPLLHDYWMYLIEKLKEGSEDIDQETEEVVEGVEEQQEESVNEATDLEQEFYDTNLEHYEEAQALQGDLHEELQEQLSELVEEMVEELTEDAS